MQEGSRGPLTDTFRMSAKCGYASSLIEIANVTPIFKEGDRSATSDYPAISLASLVGNILESIMARSILDHLE